MTTLMALFMLTTPALSGERLENRAYTTPDMQLHLGFACETLERIEHFLDNMQKYIDAGVPPVGCAIINPRYSVAKGAESILHLYSADDDKVWAVLEVPVGDDLTVYTYAPVGALKKIGGDT